MKEEFYCLPLGKKVKSKITSVVKKKSYSLKSVHKVGDKSYNLNKVCSKARAEEVAAALGIEIEHIAAAETLAVPEDSFIPEGTGNVVGQNTAGMKTAIPATEETSTANTTPFHSDSDDKIGPMSMSAETLSKTSCCCGATVEKPCACMTADKPMECSAVEPKCACYSEQKDAESVPVGPAMLDPKTGAVGSSGTHHVIYLEGQWTSVLCDLREWMINHDTHSIPAQFITFSGSPDAITELLIVGDPNIEWWVKKLKAVAGDYYTVDQIGNSITISYNPNMGIITGDKVYLAGNQDAAGRSTCYGNIKGGKRSDEGDFEDNQDGGGGGGPPGPPGPPGPGGGGGGPPSPHDTTLSAETFGVSYAIEPDHWLRLQAHPEWQSTRGEVNVERQENFWIITSHEVTADDLLELIIDTADTELTKTTPVNSKGIGKGITLGIGVLGIAASIMLLRRFNKE
jgi:hypothetical protein